MSVHVSQYIYTLSMNVGVCVCVIVCVQGGGAGVYSWNANPWYSEYELLVSSGSIKRANTLAMSSSSFFF